MRFEGVYVANVTFFDDNGWISLPSFKKHLDWLAASGVQGFVPCGTTGEGSAITLEEREKLLGLAVEVAAAKGLKVIAGCGGNVTSQVIDLIRQAKTLGCDAALVVTPYYNKPTARGLLAHYETIAEKSEIPILLYNVPGRTSCPLPMELAAKLLRHPNIAGIKEASGQHGQWLQLAREMNCGEKSLLAGDDDALAFIEAIGGCGIISASANCIPEVFVALHRLSVQKRFEEAFRLQVRINPLIRALFMETNPAPVKYILHKAMGYEPGLRLPLVPVTMETEKALETAFTSISQELEIQ